MCDFGGRFEYNIQSGNSDRKFRTTGVISSTFALDRENYSGSRRFGVVEPPRTHSKLLHGVLVTAMSYHLYTGHSMVVGWRWLINSRHFRRGGVTHKREQRPLFSISNELCGSVGVWSKLPRSISGIYTFRIKVGCG